MVDFEHVWVVAGSYLFVEFEKFRGISIDWDWQLNKLCQFLELGRLKDAGMQWNLFQSRKDCLKLVDHWFKIFLIGRLKYNLVGHDDSLIKEYVLVITFIQLISWLYQN